MLVNYHKYKFEINTNGNNSYSIISVNYIDHEGANQTLNLPSGPISVNLTKTIADELKAVGCRILPLVKYKNSKLTIQLESFFIIQNIGYVFIDNGVVTYDFVFGDEISSIYKSNHMVVRGCLDNKAENYIPQATENDGSCTYLPTSILGLLREKTNHFNAAILHKERLGEKVCCCQYSLSKYLLKVISIAEESQNNDSLLQAEIRARAILDFTEVDPNFWQNGMTLMFYLQRPDQANLELVSEFEVNYQGKSTEEIIGLIASSLNSNSDDFTAIPNQPTTGFLTVLSPNNEAELFNNAQLIVYTSGKYILDTKKPLFSTDTPLIDPVYTTVGGVDMFFGYDENFQSLFKYAPQNDAVYAMLYSSQSAYRQGATKHLTTGYDRYLYGAYQLEAQNGFVDPTDVMSSYNVAISDYASTNGNGGRIYFVENKGANCTIYAHNDSYQRVDSFDINANYFEYLICDLVGNIFIFNCTEGKFAIVNDDGGGAWSVNYYSLSAPVGSPTHGRPILNTTDGRILFPYEGIIYVLENNGFVYRQILMGAHDLYSLVIPSNTGFSYSPGCIIASPLYTPNTRIRYISIDYNTTNDYFAPSKVFGYTSHHFFTTYSIVVFCDETESICHFEINSFQFTKIAMNLFIANPYDIIGISQPNYALHNEGIVTVHVLEHGDTGDFIRFYHFIFYKGNGIVIGLNSVTPNYFYSETTTGMLSITRMFKFNTTFIYDHNLNTYSSFTSQESQSNTLGLPSFGELLIETGPSLMRPFNVNVEDDSNPYWLMGVNTQMNPYLNSFQIIDSCVNEVSLFLATDISGSFSLLQYYLDNLQGKSLNIDSSNDQYRVSDGSTNITSITKIVGGDTYVYVLGDNGSSQNGFAVSRADNNMSYIVMPNPVENLIYTHQQSLLLVVSGTQIFLYDKEGLNQEPILNVVHDFTGHTLDMFYDRGSDRVFIMDTNTQSIIIVDINAKSFITEIFVTDIDPSLIGQKVFFASNQGKIWFSYQSNNNNGFVSLKISDPVATEIASYFEDGVDAVYETDEDKCLSLTVIDTMIDNALQLTRNCEI